MAEEFVRKEHFNEFARRMDERFDHANALAEQRHDSINRRLADAEKAREQNLVHVTQRFDDLKESFKHRFDDLKGGINQRFDNLERRMDQIHADMRQMRGWLIWLFGLVVFGFLGSIVLILFKGVFQ
jgi:tetrahydromethanopterin S-methyltransferase subunit G